MIIIIIIIIMLRLCCFALRWIARRSLCSRVVVGDRDFTINNQSIYRTYCGRYNIELPQWHFVDWNGLPLCCSSAIATWLTLSYRRETVHLFAFRVMRCLPVPEHINLYCIARIWFTLERHFLGLLNKIPWRYFSGMSPWAVSWFCFLFFQDILFDSTL